MPKTGPRITKLALTAITPFDTDERLYRATLARHKIVPHIYEGHLSSLPNSFDMCSCE